MAVPLPSLPREMCADLAPAATDFEEGAVESVLPDEAIEAVQHVVLEGDEIRHAPAASASGFRARRPVGCYLTVSLLWPNRTRRASSSLTTASH